MSNGGRFESSMAAGFSIESEEYAEEKCRGVGTHLPGNMYNNNYNSLLEMLVLLFSGILCELTLVQTVNVPIVYD